MSEFNFKKEVVNATKSFFSPLITNNYHWYAFLFFESNNTSEIRSSTYMGYSHQGINIARINEAKQAAGVSSEAVLISVSYLGYMDEENFKNGDKTNW